MRWSLAIVVLVACGDNVFVDDQPVSGTRLEVRYVELPGGLRTWDGSLFDTTLDAICYPLLAGDGKRYCLPEANDASFSDSALFTDPACEQRAALFGKPDAKGCFVLGAFAFVNNPTGPPIVSARGSAAGSAYFTGGPDGACTGPTDVPDDEQLFTVGPPLTNLAEVQTSVAVQGERLGARVMTSDDGLHLPLREFHDATLDADCGDGHGTCFPTNAGLVDNAKFADATCTTHAVDGDTGGPPPPYGVLEDDDACSPQPYRAFAVVSTPLTSVFEDSSAGVCVPAALDGATVYAAGDEIALASLTRTREPGGGRFRAIQVASADGQSFRDGFVFDTLLGVECFPFAGEDGVASCFPQGTFVEPDFTDAACTQAITLVPSAGRTDECDTPAAPALALDSIPGTCFSSQAYFRVGARHDAAVFEISSGVCVPADPNVDRYEVGSAYGSDAVVAGPVVTGED